MKMYFINKETTEMPVLTKVSEKGLYFGPFYKAITIDNKSHYITKSQYENETNIPAYKTDISLYTFLDMVIEGSILLIFIFIVFSMIILCLYYFYKRFFRNDINKSWREWIHKITNIFLLLYVVVTTLLLLFVFWNTIQKIAPFGHDEKVAEIVDRNIVKGMGRFASNRYYMTIGFEDYQNNYHNVKMEVPYQLYDKYEYEYGMAIHFPTRNPANVYVQLQTFEDYFSIIQLRDVIIFIFLIGSYSYVFNRLNRHKKRDNTG